MKKLLFFIIVSAITFSCKPKFDPFDDFKEVDVVYSVLDPDAPKQYVYVGRAFQTDGENAIDVSKNVDSVYQSDSMLVEIIEYKNGEETKRAELQKETFDSREEGVFANPEHYLYTLDNSVLDIDTNTDYSIKITNTFSGKTSIAKVKTLKSFYFENVVGNTQYYPNFIKDDKIQDAKIKVINEFSTNVLFETTVTIPYFTKDEDKNIIDSNAVQYVVSKSKTGVPSSTTEINFDGNIFFNSIFDNVPEISNPKHTREFGIVLLNVKCFDVEMYNYVVAEQSFNSLSQSKPFYTNVYDINTDEKQSGLVSSVKEQELVLFLNKEKEYIIETKPNLGFTI